MSLSIRLIMALLLLLLLLLLTKIAVGSFFGECLLKHCNIFLSVLDLYADTPPLETLMEVPLHTRRTQLFKVGPELHAAIFSYSPMLGIWLRLQWNSHLGRGGGGGAILLATS